MGYEENAVSAERGADHGPVMVDRRTDRLVEVLTPILRSDSVVALRTHDNQQPDAGAPLANELQNLRGHDARLAHLFETIAL